MLEFSPVISLVTIFVFFTLMIVLNKILYRPLLEFIDKRDDSIKRDLENAGKNSSDVEAYYNEANQIILKAKAEAGKIREDALNKARESAIGRVEQKQDDLEREYASFLKSLEVDTKELQESLSANIPLFRDGIKQKLSSI
jgi:F-type H+-transporting ATPase subunit b